MEKDPSFNDFFEEDSSSKKSQHLAETNKVEDIKKNSRGRGRPRQYPLIETTPSNQIIESFQSLNQSNNSNNLQSFNSLQSETSKYQRLQEFWRSQIETYYRSKINEDEKEGLRKII